MKEKLKTILEESKKQLENATSLQEADETRVKVLGKKGALTEILRSMGGLSPEERKELGQAANQVRAERNKAIKSRVKTYVKKVDAAVAAGDKAAAEAVLPVAIAEISKAASKGIFHKNTAARKVSRITKAVNTLA